MATMQPQDPSAMQDPAAGGMEGIEPAAPEGQGGYEVCIRVTPEGMSIGVEQPGAEMAEAETAYQPVASMQELVQAIATIIKSNGQMGNRAEEQAGFEQGFAG